jgi:hypothetical protein
MILEVKLPPRGGVILPGFDRRSVCERHWFSQPSTTLTANPPDAVSLHFTVMLTVAS